MEHEGKLKRSVMNEKNSQERLEALVTVVAGLFNEAQQRLEEKKAEHLESTVTMSGRVDQAFKKYQEATEVLKNVENEGSDKATPTGLKVSKVGHDLFFSQSFSTHPTHFAGEGTGEGL